MVVYPYGNSRRQRVDSKMLWIGVLWHVRPPTAPVWCRASSGPATIHRRTRCACNTIAIVTPFHFVSAGRNRIPEPVHRKSGVRMRVELHWRHGNGYVDELRHRCCLHTVRRFVDRQTDGYSVEFSKSMGSSKMGYGSQANIVPEKLKISWKLKKRVWYDTIAEFNVDSKAECYQLNLAHETKTKKHQCPVR